MCTSMSLIRRMHAHTHTHTHAKDELEEDGETMETGDEPETGQEMAVVLHEVCMKFHSIADANHLPLVEIA